MTATIILISMAGCAAPSRVGTVDTYLDKQANELTPVADTRRMRDGVLVYLKTDLLFENESAVLKPEAHEQLIELGQILSKYRQDRIGVSGFTDIVGSDAHNQQLSARRASVIKTMLASQGVEPAHMIAAGFGESNPVANNTSPEGRVKNRRIELYIDIPESRVPASDSAK